MAAPTIQHARVRLEFVKNKSKANDTIASSWMLINYTCMKLISDVADEIKRRYIGTCDHISVSLLLKGSRLPAWESSYILRDGDCVQVRVGSELELDRPTVKKSTPGIHTDKPIITLSNEEREQPLSEEALAEKHVLEHMEVSAHREHKHKKKKKRKLKVKSSGEDYRKENRLLLISEAEFTEKSDRKKRRKDISETVSGADDSDIESEPKASSEGHLQERQVKSVEVSLSNAASLSRSSNTVVVKETTDRITDKHHNKDERGVDTQMYENMDVSGTNGNIEHLNSVQALDNNVEKGGEDNSNEGAVSGLSPFMEAENTEQMKRKRKRTRKRRQRNDQVQSDTSLTDSSLHTNWSNNTHNPHNTGTSKEMTRNQNKAYFGCAPGKLEPPQYYRHGYRNLHAYEKDPNKHTKFDSNSDDNNSKTTENSEQYSFHREVHVESSENMESLDRAETHAVHVSHSSRCAQTSVGNQFKKNVKDVPLSYSSAPTSVDSTKTPEGSVSRYCVPSGGNLCDSQGPPGGGAGVGPGVAPTVLGRAGLPSGAIVFSRKRPWQRQIPELSKQQQLDTVATNKSSFFKVPDQQPVKLSKEIKFCQDLIEELVTAQQQYAWPIDGPVDAVSLKLPDDHDVIKKPMDLSAIAGKIQQHEYSGPTQFANDVRLIIDNCCRYNPPGSDVIVMARQLRAVFEARFAELPCPGRVESQDDNNGSQDNSNVSQDSEDDSNDTELDNLPNQKLKSGVAPFSVSPTEMMIATDCGVVPIPRGSGAGSSPRQYTKLSVLAGLPRTGDHIVYKVLEVSANYTPEVSQYKMAEVLGVDEGQNIRLKTMHDERQPRCGREGGKFDLAMDDGDGAVLTNVAPAQAEVTVPWQSMLEPRLIS